MTTRRQFIRTTAAGAAVLAAGTAAFPNLIIPKKKDRLGVALIGLGYYSRDLLAPALQVTKKCYLAGIVTGSPEKAKQWQEKHGIPDKNVYNYDNFDSIADNPDIDVVYVVLPNNLHKEFTLRGARAGKHVWCEKPMAMNAAECRDMIKGCRDNKVKLSIGYRMQHEPNTQEIIRYGKEKTLGAVRLVTASAGFRDSRTDHWRLKKAMGGGAMFDMGVYSLNAARYATSEEPIGVTAQQFTTRPELYSEVDETMLFQLEFPGGALANCSTSFGMGMNTLHTVCEKGWYRLDPFQAYRGVQGVTSTGKALNIDTPNEQAKQMDEDAAAIMDNTDVLVPGEEGLRDMIVVDAIYQSVKEGRRVPVDSGR
ncbi:MAG: Gfo/Idh/MocA family oxidoreductase [Lewinellaceae bacterium]|nr:Gfo/Idh/MocA family oxidoreductase [Lewinella sp.]MCB9279337.1 Gfo/Idh/MocA family oxidoreductase [Lewinellaceae bacterium]